MELERDEADRELAGDQTGLMSDEEFDREVEQASRGEWAELGLDPPGQRSDAEASPGFKPSTTQEFLDGT